MCSTQIMLWKTIFTHFNDYFAGNIALCVLKIILTHLNALLFYVCMFTLSNTFQLSICVSIVGSFINFARLKQADSLLIGKSNCFPKNRLVSSLRAFEQWHGACLKSIFASNDIFGSQLTLYLLLCTPTNAFMICCWFLGRVPPKSYVTAFGIIATQATYIFGVHLVAATQYPPRIHRSSKRLIQINARYPLRNTRAQLKLLHLIYMLHVRPKYRYGITYSSQGLSSKQTFVKVRLTANSPLYIPEIILN